MLWTSCWRKSRVVSDPRRHVTPRSCNVNGSHSQRNHKGLPVWQFNWICYSIFCGQGCKPAWWRHQMETFSALLALCSGNSPVTGEFPAQRPMTRRLMFSLICALNKRFSKQSWGWWFVTPSRSLWRQCNAGRHSLFTMFYHADSCRLT